MADDGGLSRFQKRMRDLPRAMKTEVEKALAKSAQEIVDLAKSLCPVDEGALRDSIGWTFGTAPEGARMVAQSAPIEGLTVTVYAGNDEAFYARWVEMGTQAGIFGQRVASQSRRSGRRKSYRTHSGTAAQPFFFPAYRLLKKRSQGRIRRAIGKAVRDNWGNT